MLTGVRLAVGTAWLVIVAAEMLTGGVGIGFWVWDEWNNLNVKNIIIAIFVIGLVGLVLEYALIKLASAFTFEEVKNWIFKISLNAEDAKVSQRTQKKIKKRTAKFLLKYSKL